MSRKSVPMPLDTMRRKLKSQGKEIAELKQRLDKVEVAVGRTGSTAPPPARELSDDVTNSDEDQDRPGEGEG